MSVTVITSLYGDYDIPLAPPPQTVVADYLMVTDREHEVDGWKQITEPRTHMHPRMAAKVAKCRPDLYTDAEFTVWVDASFWIKQSGFIAWCLDHLGSGDIAQIVHPERVSIVDEADVSEHMGKYAGHTVLRQAHHYVESGFPDPWGLWATGLIVRRNTARLAVFGDAWLREQQRWTYQDQVSEPFVLWDHGLTVSELPGPLWEHEMFMVRPHARRQ